MINYPLLPLDVYAPSPEFFGDVEAFSSINRNTEFCIVKEYLATGKIFYESRKSSYTLSFGDINAQCLRQYGVTVCCSFYIIYSVRLTGSFLLENKIKWNDVKKNYASKVLFNFFRQAFSAASSDKCISIRSVSETDFHKNNGLMRNKRLNNCAKVYHHNDALYNIREIKNCKCYFVDLTHFHPCLRLSIILTEVEFS